MCFLAHGNLFCQASLVLICLQVQCRARTGTVHMALFVGSMIINKHDVELNNINGCRQLHYAIILIVISCITFKYFFITLYCCGTFIYPTASLRLKVLHLNELKIYISLSLIKIIKFDFIPSKSHDYYLVSIFETTFQS